MNLVYGRSTGEPIYLEDFSSFIDSGTAGREASARRWHLQKNRWGARNEELLVADPETEAPVLSFSPDVKGCHAIFVGAYAPGNRGGFAPVNHGIYVRLDGDPHFTYLQLGRPEPSYQEMFFRTADLTGRRIEIGNFEKCSSLDYVHISANAPYRAPTIAS